MCYMNSHINTHFSLGAANTAPHLHELADAEYQALLPAAAGAGACGCDGGRHRDHEMYVTLHLTTTTTSFALHNLIYRSRWPCRGWALA